MARNSNVIKLPRERAAPKVIGSKVSAEHALIPYGEREFIQGAFRPCQFCKHWFTFLGRRRHENKCPENPDVIKAKKKAKVR